MKGLCMPAPKYVKFVDLENNTAGSVTVTGSFESGNTAQFVAPSGGSVTIQR
jgi:hypothetical protein